jgi:hypothetical protein
MGGDAMERSIEQVFARLDRWRHLPKYQLERRADIFFSLYLPEVIEKHFGVEVEAEMIPEFPLQTEAANNLSNNVDYVLLSEDRQSAFFVELKTTNASIGKKQLQYLRRTQEKSFAQYVRELVKVAATTGADRKYGHLVFLLEELGCAQTPEALADYMFKRKNRKGLTKLRQQVESTVQEDEFSIQIVYVVPTAPAAGENRDFIEFIDFEEFGNIVQQHSDPMSNQFAKYLEKWTEKAGHISPEALR